MDLSSNNLHNKHDTRVKKETISKGKILLTQENKVIFNAMLEQQLQESNNLLDSDRANGAREPIHGSWLTAIIQKALEACKRSNNKKRTTNTFPSNPWYDEECKVAKRNIKGKEANKETKKWYTKIIHTKKAEYVIARRQQLISFGKHDPKKFW